MGFTWWRIAWVSTASLAVGACSAAARGPSEEIEDGAIHDSARDGTYSDASRDRAIRDAGNEDRSADGDAGPDPHDAEPLEAPARDAGTSDVAPADARATKDAGRRDADADADGAPDTSAEASCGGSTPVTLTVMNVLVWCSISVAGGAPSAAAQQTVCVPPGVVNLAASPLPGFELGPAPWHDTSGDHGSGDPGTLVGDVDSTTVGVTSGSKCVWACCPFPDGTGCPATDQCPWSPDE